MNSSSCYSVLRHLKYQNRTISCSLKATVTVNIEISFFIKQGKYPVFAEWLTIVKSLKLK